MVWFRNKLFYGISMMVGVLFVWGLTVNSAAARPQMAVTHFEAIDIACDTFDGPGDLNFIGVLRSDDPRLAGRSEVSITFDGQRLLVDATFIPDAFDGTWVAPGHSTNDTPAPVVHKGEGTGVFAGQKIILQASVVDDPADLPCTPLGPTVKLEGIIID